ncbi:MAG: histidine kinase [Bacteroidetes bacterium]|nr:histidine kinase [Bacteroidota bacterium]
MKKSISFFALIILLNLVTHAQVQWSRDSTLPSKDAWSSYSTSYVGDINDSIPFIVTAVPSQTIGDNAPLDLDFDGSLFRFKSNLFEKTMRIYTYDSANVYFLTQGIYPYNKDRYEFRVTLNAKTIIKDWSVIDAFSNIQLNTFKQGFGFAGGYKTTWGSFIIAELRRKGSDSILSNAIICWKEIKPVIASVYTTKNLNDFLKSLSRPWDKTIKSKDISKGLILNPDENSVIFTITGEIYKKQELEFTLVKDGQTIVPWQSNEFDNNFIWLQGLSYGNYDLKIRFAKQRHNVTEYNFRVRPAWHQTTAFKIIAILIILISLLSVFLTFRVVKQRRKIKAEQSQRQNKEAELKVLRAQLNPHFIFNSLSSIQGLINNQQIENANTYLADFAALMRSTLIASDKPLHSIAEEFSALEKYLRLEQMRFHFSYSIQSSSEINATTTEIPPLLLQPIVENAVKHGVSALGEKGVVALKIEKRLDDLVIFITDNGKGFAATNENNGYGLKLTRERIALLNQVSKLKQVLFQISPSAGTTIVLTFKNWL